MPQASFVPPTADELAAARRALVEHDPALAVIDAVVPPFEWRARGAGFEGLARLIVEQQVSVIAADAIWRRLAAGLAEVTPARVLASGEEALRGYGLSRPKARYVYALAEAVASARFDFSVLGSIDDQAATQALVSLMGVGLWTAETYLMFCEGRLDVFPAGDVALQEAMRWVDRAERRPTTQEAYRRAEKWRPWRGVAAHLLWRCYGLVRRGDIAPLI